MAIQWNQLSDPNFSAGNNLLVQGQGMWDKAAQQASQGLNNFAQGLEKQNTNKLMDMLYQAKDPTQFQSPEFQQGLASLRNQLGQDYDHEAFRTANDNRLGKLQNDGLNAIKFTDVNQEVANRGATTNWLNAYASNDVDGMRTAEAQMQGGLRPEMLTQGMGLLKDRHGMTMQDKGYNLDVKKANWDHEDNQARIGLARDEFEAKRDASGDGGLLGGYNTESMSPTGDLTSGYGNAKVPKGAQPYAGMVSSASKQHGVPENVLYGLMHTESSFNPRALSTANAKGLMQITPITQKELKLKDPYDPATSIEASARYLSTLTKRFGSLEKGLAAYNMGPSAYQLYLEGKRKMPAETRDYVKNVSARARQYQGDAKGFTDEASLNDIVATGKAKHDQDVAKATAKRQSLGMYSSAGEVKGIGTREDWRAGNNTTAGRSIYTGAVSAKGFNDLLPAQQVSLLQSAKKAEAHKNTDYQVPDWVPFKGGMRLKEDKPVNEWVKNYIEQQIQEEKTLKDTIVTTQDKQRQLEYNKARVTQARKAGEKKINY